MMVDVYFLNMTIYFI